MSSAYPLDMGDVIYREAAAGKNVRVVHPSGYVLEFSATILCEHVERMTHGFVRDLVAHRAAATRRYCEQRFALYRMEQV